MNPETQRQQIEISMEDAKENVALAEALERLHQNADFKKIIVDGYFEKEASRAVLLRGDPAMVGEKEQAQVNNIITSIGGLYNFFHKVFRMGEMSAQSLEADAQTVEEIAREELEEGGLH